MSGSARHGKRRIAVVTGTRAEYGLLQSTMEAITARRGMQLQLVVTGMHLLRGFGHTIDIIRRDGWSIDAEVRMQRGSDTPTDQADGLARGIAGIAAYIERASTDVVVVLGDRIEALAGALAAVTTGRLVAHIHGGDRASGGSDDTDNAVDADGETVVLEARAEDLDVDGGFDHVRLNVAEVTGSGTDDITGFLMRHNSLTKLAEKEAAAVTGVTVYVTPDS